MSRTMGAAESAPNPPACTSAATTISGLRRGAKPTNHALFLKFDCFPARCNPCALMTCAVPVFPHNSMPGSLDAAAVPPSLTTPYIACVSVSTVDSEMGKSISGDAWSDLSKCG